MAIGNDPRALIRLDEAERAAGQGDNAVGGAGSGSEGSGIADDREGVDAAQVVLSLVPCREVPEKLVSRSHLGFLCANIARLEGPEMRSRNRDELADLRVRG